MIKVSLHPSPRAAVLAALAELAAQQAAALDRLPAMHPHIAILTRRLDRLQAAISGRALLPVETEARTDWYFIDRAVSELPQGPYDSRDAAEQALARLDQHTLALDRPVCPPPKPAQARFEPPNKLRPICRLLAG